jgi:hypothetical protein
MALPLEGTHRAEGIGAGGLLANTRPHVLHVVACKGCAIWQTGHMNKLVSMVVLANVRRVYGTAGCDRAMHYCSFASTCMG